MATNILLVGIGVWLILPLLFFFNLISEVFLYVVGLLICGGILIGYEVFHRAYRYVSLKREYREYVKKLAEKKHKS